MRILHYALGFTPYRSGGLTRYVMDLTGAQRAAGHAVAMLWPGRMRRDDRPYVRRHRDIGGVSSFELCGPLPVVLDRPVGDPDLFHRPAQGEGYARFLDATKPDIIHIHTLQGLHREFLDAARARGIPTVFTTHDFFGLYPMNQVYPMDHALSDEECSRINVGAPSPRAICLLQSPLVRFAKSSTAVRGAVELAGRLRPSPSPVRGAVPMTPDGGKTPEPGDIEVKRYSAFRDYEVSMLERMDMILYNSTVSKTAYERYCSPRASTVIPVIHDGLPGRAGRGAGAVAGAGDGRIRIAFLGGDRPYKGLSTLMEAIGLLRGRGLGRNLHIDVYGVRGVGVADVADAPTVSFRDAFDDFAEAMRHEDVVIVPSLTYESFGFVVLEALCAGLPVMATDCVGAADIIPQGCGFPLGAGSPDEMAAALASLDRASVDAAADRIARVFTPPSFDEHVSHIENHYTTVIAQTGEAGRR